MSTGQRLREVKGDIARIERFLPVLKRVLTMLREIGSPDNVAAWVDDRLSRKKVIWGFGHREYRVKDPRATILQGLNHKVFDKLGRTPLYDIALALEEHLAGKPISVELTNPLGCNIKWKDQDAHWMPADACDLVLPQADAVPAD